MSTIEQAIERGIEPKAPIVSEDSHGLGMRHFWGTAFEYVCQAAIWVCLVILVVLILATLWKGIGILDWRLLTRNPSVSPERAGLWVAIMGSTWLLVLTASIAVPTGVAAAIFLEEYAPNTWWVGLIRTNIANLAGVPSVVYGMLGLGVFANFLALGPSVLSAALTLSLVILPVIIIASQEALRAVPGSLRNASYALGATRWQTIWHQVLPSAVPGIMTGVILALSRAIGEAAPLITIGVAGLNFSAPDGLMDRYAALPVQIYLWATDADAAFREKAAGGIIVLLVLLLCMNAIAIFIRYRYSQATTR